MGGIVSSLGKESSVARRTHLWPEELEVALAIARGLSSSVRVTKVNDVLVGLGCWNSLHGNTKCPDGAISNRNESVPSGNA